MAKKAWIMEVLIFYFTFMISCTYQSEGIEVLKKISIWKGVSDEHY